MFSLQDLVDLSKQSRCLEQLLNSEMSRLAELMLPVNSTQDVLAIKHFVKPPSTPSSVTNSLTVSSSGADRPTVPFSGADLPVVSSSKDNRPTRTSKVEMSNNSKRQIGFGSNSGTMKMRSGDSRPNRSKDNTDKDDVVTLSSEDEIVYSPASHLRTGQNLAKAEPTNDEYIEVSTKLDLKREVWGVQDPTDVAFDFDLQEATDVAFDIDRQLADDGTIKQESSDRIHPAYDEESPSQNENSPAKKEKPPSHDDRPLSTLDISRVSSLNLYPNFSDFARAYLELRPGADPTTCDQIINHLASTLELETVQPLLEIIRDNSDPKKRIEDWIELIQVSHYIDVVYTFRLPQKLLFFRMSFRRSPMILFRQGKLYPFY